MKIDFYILENADKQKSLIFACQLIEKIYTQHDIYIHLQSKEAAEYFDNLLWCYREDSFLPHQIYDASDNNPPPIQIGYQANLPQHKATLINLHQEVPSFYQDFNRLIEIVFSEPTMQQLARERYKQYRDQGHELVTYKEKL
jgi:DNA polymerase-3 subunit chi